MVVAFVRPGAVGHFAKGVRVQVTSASASPDGARLVTSGGDGRIKLWRMSVLLDDAPASDADGALLCSLANDEKEAQCVRWSPCGHFVASGDDAGLVKLWVRLGSAGPGAGALVDSGAPTNVENWKCVVTFKGHAMDVLCLSWSPAAEPGYPLLLASGSIDNTVRVWEVPDAYRSRTLGCIETSARAVLRGHDGWVKSVAWDPVGRFLASSSDDKSVVVWRCSDWRLEARIKAPFAGGTATSMRRQLCWSPDGEFLCCSHAFDEPRHVALVVGRNAWSDAQEGAVRLVGHTAAVSVCAFSPTLYESGGPAAAAPVQQTQQQPQPQQSRQRAAVVAVACERSTLSLWTPGSERPVVVCKKAFSQQLLDLQWSADGRLLIMCGMDGFVAALDCRDFAGLPSVGAPMSNDRLRQVLTEHYGDAGQREEPALAETPLQFALEASQARAPREPAAAPAAPFAPAGGLALQPNLLVPRRANGAPAASAPAPVVAAPQQESRTADGKRRIAPVSLSAISAAASSAARDPGSPGLMTRVMSSSSSSFSVPASGAGAFSGAHAHRVAASSPSPVVLVAPAASSTMAPAGLLRAARCARHAQLRTVGGRSPEWLKLESVPLKQPKGQFECTVSLLRQDRVAWSAVIPGRAAAVAGNARFVAVATRAGEVYLLGSSGQLLLPPMQMPAKVACLVAGEDARSPFLACATCDAALRVWDLDNMVAVLRGVSLDPLLLPALAEEHQEQPQRRRPRPVTLWGSVQTSRTEAAAAADPAAVFPTVAGAPAGAVAIASVSGGPSSSSAAVDNEDDEAGSSAASSASDDSEVENAAAANAQRRKQMLGAAAGRSAKACAAVLSESARLLLTPLGTPLLLVVRREIKDSLLRPRTGLLGQQSAAFAYSSDMAAWVRVADADRFLRSDFYSTLALEPPAGAQASAAALDAGVLHALQAAAAAGAPPGEAARRATALLALGADMASSRAAVARQRALSRTHLETLVGASALMRTPQEYRAWLAQYARRLTDDGDAPRLTALCDSLLGPVEPQGNGDRALLAAIQSSHDTKQRLVSEPDMAQQQTRFAWAPHALAGAFDKRQLLRDFVLPAMARNRKLQGLVLEYNDALLRAGGSGLVAPAPGSKRQRVDID